MPKPSAEGDPPRASAPAGASNPGKFAGAPGDRAPLPAIAPRRATLAAMRLSMLALALSVAACTPPLEPTSCVYDSDCPAPFSCVEGRCQSECSLHEECPFGRCVFAAPSVGRCFLDAVAQCGSGDLVCDEGLTCFAEHCYAPCSECPVDGVCVEDRCERAPEDAGVTD